MKRITLLLIGLFLLAPTPAFTRETAPAQLPDTPVARVMEAYLRAFNTGSVTALEEFHARHDARAERPDFHDPEMREKLMMMMKGMGELKVHRVMHATTLSLTAIIGASKGHWLAINCEVREDARDKMTVFRVDRVPAPQGEK
ncbi:MAG: hypothetical protein ACKV2V_10340 [Blastocatellia bacterium]